MKIHLINKDGDCVGTVSGDAALNLCSKTIVKFRDKYWVFQGNIKNPMFVEVSDEDVYQLQENELD